jgi:hypothetical protein
MGSSGEVDRAEWLARMAALADFEELDEGAEDERRRALTEAERWRAEHGVAPLAEWWEEKTEHLLHERARSLGLLRPVR